MGKFLQGFLAAGVVLAMTNFAPSFAEDRALQGEVHHSSNVAEEVVLMPLRVGSAAICAPVGFTWGMAQGIGHAVDKTSHATFGQIKTTKYDPASNTALTLLKAPILIPVGIVGTVAAVPLGGAWGGMKGMVTAIDKGYRLPDKL